MRPPTHYTIFDSPVGPLTLLADRDAIVGLRFATERHEPTSLDANGVRDDGHPVLRDAREQLGEYFAGTRADFDLPLRPAGTTFQQSVWDALRQIPFGETVSYGALARQVGNANAARAVGMANGRNPIAIVIPCHRVIGADGTLTGFGGGLDVKRRLLALERTSSPV